jgi:hypothetical protein
VVTHQEIEALCNSFLSAEGVRAIINEVDLNKDGRITFEEWVHAMQDQRTRGLRAVRSTLANNGPSPGAALLEKRAATLKEKEKESTSPAAGATSTTPRQQTK